MREKGCASWDRGHSTWEGQGGCVGTIMVFAGFIELCCGWKLLGQNALRMLENNRQQVQSSSIMSQGSRCQDKKNQSSALVSSSAPTPVKAVEPNCVTYGGSGTIPSNTIANPKKELKGITTRSGVAYQGPTIPTPPKVVKQGTEAVVAPVSALMPNMKSSIPYPSRRVNERRRDQDNEQIEKFYEIFKDMSFEISFTDALILMPKFASTLKALIGNKEKLSEMARIPMNEHCSAGSDFLIFEEVDAFLGLEDDLNSSKINPFYYDPIGDILLLETILNSKPLPFLPNHEQYLPSFQKELKVCEAKTVKSSVDEPPEVELKDLPPHLEYAFLEGDKKLPVIKAKELRDEEKSPFIKVLKSHKQAIAWKLSDIQALIYLISDSPWVSPVHCVPKKGGFTVVENEENELILTRLVTGWRVRIDYRKLNEATRKDHFPLPFMDRLPIDEYLSVCAMHQALFKGTLKKKITKAPILIAPNWDLPFEHMCDASDFAIVPRGLQTLQITTRVTSSLRSKWVEAKALPTNDARVVCKFLKSLFARFGSPRAIISDRDTHFCNDQFAKVMLKYGVTHRLYIAYHPQTSGQVEVSNRGSKRILERTIGENRASWSDKLDDALWAFHTSYKTPIGCTPYKLVYGKACHLLIELEHKAYWALKQANFNLTVADDHQKIQLNEINEIRDHAYENSLIYKEKTKRIHDSRIKNRVFNIGDRVLLFNSRLKIFSSKLKTRWSGPFTIAKVFPYGTIELSQANEANFKVNGHRVKHYFGGDVPQLKVLDLQTFLLNQ
nr:reverse transcriptase domain-containing protein [Tanacetum cinerariifolium]